MNDPIQASTHPTSDGHGLVPVLREPPTEPMRTLSNYEQKVVRARQMGLVYPYELIRMLAPARDTALGNGRESLGGEFFEYDLNSHHQLAPVSRPPGENGANTIVGVIRNYTAKYPDGITRVILLGDPIRDLGALAEPECRRIIAAIDLAEQKRVPLEWFALSAGAKISMDNGTENMDWIALVLRRIVRFTQHGISMARTVAGTRHGKMIPSWRYSLAFAYNGKGDKETALFYLDDYLRLAPHDTEAARVRDRLRKEVTVHP